MRNIPFIVFAGPLSPGVVHNEIFYHNIMTIAKVSINGVGLTKPSKTLNSLEKAYTTV